MKNNMKKPIRIDYYPKSEETIDGVKDIKVHLSENPAFHQNRMTDRTRDREQLLIKEEPILKWGDSRVDHIEITEEKIFNKTEEVEPKKEIEIEEAEEDEESIDEEEYDEEEYIDEEEYDEEEYIDEEEYSEEEAEDMEEYIEEIEKVEEIEEGNEMIH